MLSSADGRRILNPRPPEPPGLPPDLLLRARQRIRLTALLAAGAFALSLAVDLVSRTRALSGAPASSGSGAAASVIVDAGGVAVALALFMIGRHPRVGFTAVLRSALITEVLVCAAIAAETAFVPVQGGLGAPTVSWVTPIIIALPLIVPAPPRAALVSSVAAALTVPIAVLAAGGPLVEALRASVSPVIAVGIAFVGARVVYRIGLDVARASHVGSYRLDEPLGRGGMGEVWSGTHRLLARPAAIKLIRPEALAPSYGESAERVVARFEREARATARLRSPHTVQLYDFGVTDDGCFYLVMELLDGIDLQTLVRTSGPLAPARVAHIVSQTCDSLGEAHALGLVHRDVKPANVLLCRQANRYDVVKVLDFGLVLDAREGDRSASFRTAENVVCGTPAYMSPEQIGGDRRVDGRSDLYALGCVAYWLLTGHVVFEAAPAARAMMHHVESVPAPPSSRTTTPIPPSLESLVMDCLAKDPDRRPPDAASIRRRLSEARDIPSWLPSDAESCWSV